jgi:hypothetical protein
MDIGQGAGGTTAVVGNITSCNSCPHHWNMKNNHYLQYVKTDSNDTSVGITLLVEANL